MIIKKEVRNNCKSLKAISDPVRLSLLHMLLDKNTYVGEMIKNLKIEPTLLSHHLSVLKSAGLIKGIRKGKEVIYELRPNVRVRGGKSGINLDGCRIIL